MHATLRTTRHPAAARLLAAFAVLGAGGASLHAQATWVGVTDTYATASNWSTNAIPTGADNNNRAIFNGSGSATVTLDANRTARLAFDSTTTSYTISGGSFLAGSGADMVRLESTNTVNHTVNSDMYFGGASGIINIIRNNSSSNTLTMGGAIGGQSAVAGISNVLQFSSTSANSKVVLGGAVSDTLAGRTGSGNLVLQKIGGSTSLGNLTLNGNNTYSGGTEFYTGSGTLTVGHSKALGTGELRVYGGGLAINANTDLSGANALANTIRFNGAVSNVAGTTDITGLVAGSNTVTVSNATGLAVGQQINYSVAARSFPVGTYITAINGTTLTLSNAVPTGASTTSVSSGSSRFQSFGSGSGTHTISGSQNIEFSGTMYLGSGRADAGTAVQTFNVTNTGLTTFSGVLTQETSIEGTGQVIGALTKSGSGTLVLSGANNYTGATTIATNGGTLLVNGNQSAATGSVTVNSGGTLGGFGTLGGSTTIGAGGILAPGVGAGVLSFTGNLSLNGTSVSNFEINGSGRGTGYDGVNVGGNLAYGGTLNLSFGSVLASGGTFDLFTVTGTRSGSFSLISLQGSYGGSLVSGVTQTINGQDFTFTNSTGQLVVTAIPEPSAFAALAGLGALGLASLRRRRAS